MALSGKSSEGWGWGRAGGAALRLRTKPCRVQQAHRLKCNRLSLTSGLGGWLRLSVIICSIRRLLMNWVVALIKSSRLRKVVWQFQLIYCVCDIWAWFIVLTCRIVFGHLPCTFSFWFEGLTACKYVVFSFYCDFSFLFVVFFFRWNSSC